MKELPKEYKLLKEIGNCIEKFLNSPNTPIEIRSTELYDIVSKIAVFKTEFPTGKAFNQFLRKYHDNGIMHSFLSYRVDTSDYRFYQWHFRRKSALKPTTQTDNETYEGTFNYYEHSKTNLANDETKLNSEQEVFIYHELKKCSHLIIKIEYPVTHFGETKFADFQVENKHTGKKFIWEHFGMTNSDGYKSKMVEKLEWYKNNGYKTIKEGGNLIYTFYSNHNNFKKDVDNSIKKITVN